MAEFHNQAMLSSVEGTIMSNEIHGKVMDRIEVNRESLPGCYAVGDNIGYVIQIINNSDIDYSNLTVTDNLGKNMMITPLDYTQEPAKYYINGEPQGEITPKATMPLIFDKISVPAGETAAVAYNLKVNENAPFGEGAAITTTTSVTHSTLCSPVTAQDIIEICNQPRLSIIKNACPLTVTEGDYITYTFTVENRGVSEADADDKIVLTDVFNPRLGGISVTYNGEIWQKGIDYDYSETTGFFKSKAVIKVPAAGVQMEDSINSKIIKPGISVITIRGKVK